MLNNVIFNNNLFLFQLLYKLQFSTIIKGSLSRLEQIRELAFNCGSFHIYLFLLEEERKLASKKVRLVNEKIDVTSVFNSKFDSLLNSSQKEPFFHKLSKANAKFKLTSFFIVFWTAIVLLGVFLESGQQFYPIAVITAIVLILATLPGLIFWNRCEVSNLLKKKRIKRTRSLELEDSLNMSREFREKNDFNMLTLDEPSSSVKIKNFKLASIYNQGKHYIDYNKQRCKLRIMGQIFWHNSGFSAISLKNQIWKINDISTRTRRIYARFV